MKKKNRTIKQNQPNKTPHNNNHQTKPNQSPNKQNQKNTPKNPSLPGVDSKANFLHLKFVKHRIITPSLPHILVDHILKISEPDAYPSCLWFGFSFLFSL